MISSFHSASNFLNDRTRSSDGEVALSRGRKRLESADLRLQLYELRGEAPTDAEALTEHGRRRLKGRGISMDQVEVLKAFGTPQRVHGATRYAFDKQSRKDAALHLCREAIRRLRSLDIVVVVDDAGRVITAAHRTKRLRRDLN